MFLPFILDPVGSERYALQRAKDALSRAVPFGDIPPKTNYRRDIGCFASSFAPENPLEKLYPRLPWLGVWPGVIECEEYDFWCVGPPWIPSSKTAPGAGHDLNRLQRDTYWDPLARRRYRRSF